MENPVHQHGHLVLTLFVNVEQADLGNLQLLTAQRDGFDNSGGEGTAAANNGDNHR